MNFHKIFGSILLVSLILSGTKFVSAESAGELNNQRDVYEEQLRAAQLQAQQKQLEVNDLRTEIAKVDRNIAQIESTMRLTDKRIKENEVIISDFNAKITAKETELKVEEDKIRDIVTSYYMEGESGLLTVVMNSSTVSEATDKFEQYESVKDQLDISAGKIKVIRDNLVDQKNSVEQKVMELKEMKEAQTAQRADLENQRQLKDSLLNDSENALTALRQQAREAQGKISEIDQRIRALTAVSSWGGQIVSSNDNSWYYTQIGNYTRLGSSPYTVDQYGCLITSMAMVATYYGHNVTPSQIASTPGIFNSGGYLMVSSPSMLGASITGNQPINWGVVDSEIAAGRPVIVSVFLPSVGKINNDGSSHFIVIKDKVGGKYLMHDPISGQRGYDMGQVRSMRLTRP